MPAPNIVNTSDEPPNDTNGSGMPETGSSPTTPPMLTAACADDPHGDPGREQQAEAVAGVQRGADAERGERDEQPEHDQACRAARAPRRSSRR